MIKKIKLFLISILSIIIISYFIDLIKIQHKAHIETLLINSYFINEKDQKPTKLYNTNDKYFGIIEIPKINLKRGFYSIKDTRNNIEQNITVLKKDKKDLILAAHSGNSSIAYFNNIHLLEKGDEIYLYINNKKNKFIVNKKYLDDKDNKVKISQSGKKRIILITCNNNDKKNYLVIESYIKI